MRGSTKKRLAIVGGAVTTVGAAAALVAGSTFGFFSSAGVASGPNTFTAGTVIVGLDEATSVTCAIGPMSPGDTQAKAGNVACKYDIIYTGNVNAYLAMDLTFTGASGTPVVAHTQTTAPAAAQSLYDGTASGLQVSIVDDTAVSYFSGVEYMSQVPAATTLTPTGGAASVSNLLVNTAPVVANATRSVTVNYTLPTTAGNAYNTATSTIVLKIHAVQADNNAVPVGCTLGAVCTTSMNWS